jgi:hypothetical protein
VTSHQSQIFRNFFTFEHDTMLAAGGTGPTFGRSITQYEIRKRRDVKNLSSYLGYVLMMKQRIMIIPHTTYTPGLMSTSSYTNYPAILVNKLDISANTGANIVLQQMFPKTLNSQVSTATSTDQQDSSGTSYQNTAGSSSSNVNTFGIGVSGGIFGDLPVATLSLEYSHTWEKSHMKSSTQGSSTGAAHSFGDSATMSIKDWSSYGYLDDMATSPAWIWGQSYPWDVILYNQTSDGTHANLPQFVSNRMVSGNMILPPSQLSLFGLDFIMTAGWIIDFPEGVTENETVTIQHTTTYYTASHSNNSGELSATLQTRSEASEVIYSPDALDLSTYALEPILSPAKSNGAAIGFLANSFTYPPKSTSDSFKIVSPAGNLQMTGKGFGSPMTTTFTEPVSLTFTFKITDTSNDYSLLVMHWIGKDSGPVELRWTVNGQWKGLVLVSDAEGSGGQNNVSSIVLRNTDFTSISFHDYLVVGANTVEVEIVPVNNGGNSSYTLFAAAIGDA